MNKHVSDQELSAILHEVNTEPKADFPSVIEHTRPSVTDVIGPKVVVTQWELADLSVGEWFARSMKLIVAIWLVGFVVSIPTAAIYVLVVAATASNRHRYEEERPRVTYDPGGLPPLGK